MTGKRASLSGSAESGFALFGTLLLTILSITLGAAAMVYSAIELRSTSNYKQANASFAAAESGVVHALTTINRRMVKDFRRDIQDDWDSSTVLLGSAVTPMQGNANRDYQVLVRAMSGDTDDQGFIVSRGRALLGARRIVSLRVVRSGIRSAPGAIFSFEEGPVDHTFNGNSFNVDGHDWRIDPSATGNDPPWGNSPSLNPQGRLVPGLTTQTADNRDEALRSLSDDQRDNIDGLGFQATASGTTPSILPTGGPGEDDILTIMNDILARTPACPDANGDGVSDSTADTECVFESDNANINAADLPLGTPDNPVIIRLSRAGGVRINGNWTGYGILIVDGPLDVNGTMNFTGLVLARSGFDSHATGTANILGSFWTGTGNLTVGGNTDIRYSSEALDLADRAGVPVFGNNGNLPSLVTVVGWIEGVPDPGMMVSPVSF